MQLSTRKGVKIWKKTETFECRRPFSIFEIHLKIENAILNNLKLMGNGKN